MVEQSLMMIRSLMVLGDMGRALSSIYEKHLDKDNASHLFSQCLHEPYNIPKSIKSVLRKVECLFTNALSILTLL
jgi:hypothetical protein